MVAAARDVRGVRGVAGGQGWRVRDRSWQSLVARQLRRIEVDLTALLVGFDETRLDERLPGFPTPVGWTAWHISRRIDRDVAEVADRRQQWLEGWSDVFERMPDPLDTGAGHTEAEVAAFRPLSLEVLLGYHAATQGAALEYLACAPDDDASRQVTDPNTRVATCVEARLAESVHDAVTHLGQIGVLRRLLHQP